MQTASIRFLGKSDERRIRQTIERHRDELASWFPLTYRVIAATGCRPSEITGRNARERREPEEGYVYQSGVKEHPGLRAKDVLPDHMLHVLGKHTKGGKGRTTKLKPRAVVCADRALYREILALAQRMRPDDHLFGLGPNPRFRQWDGYRHFIQEVRKLRDFLPDHLKAFSPRWLRHTWAVSALRYGVDLVSVQRQLGHEDLQTTAIYLRFAPTDRDKIIRAFSGEKGHLEARDCPSCGFAWNVDTRTGAMDVSDRAGAILKRFR